MSEKKAPNSSYKSSEVKFEEADVKNKQNLQSPVDEKESRVNIEDDYEEIQENPQDSITKNLEEIKEDPKSGLDTATSSTSAIYYKKSYAESQDLDRYLGSQGANFEDQMTIEEENEEIEISVFELSEKSDPGVKDEIPDEDSIPDGEGDKRLSIQVSFSLPNKAQLQDEGIERRMEEQNSWASESDESGVVIENYEDEPNDPLTVTPNVELEDSEVSDEHEEYLKTLPVTERKSVNHVSFICEQLGTIMMVKVVLEGHEAIKTSYGINIKISDVKIRVASILHLGPDDIDLYFEGRDCGDQEHLSDFGVRPPDILILHLKVKNQDHDIFSDDYLHYVPLIDIANMRIPLGDDYFKDKLICIENDRFLKEWLGGYKDVRTNREYHNAQIQTLPRPPGEKLPPRLTRQTQTPVFPLVDEAVSSPANKATQVWRTDLYIPNCSDKIIIADPSRFISKTRDFHMATVVLAALSIKRFIKKWQDEKLKKKELESNRLQLEEMKKNKKSLGKKEAQRRRKINLFFPTTRFDFSMVYLIVSAWTQKEKHLIDQTKTDASRRAAYVSLLKKETDLLWTIERQRLAVKKEALKRSNLEFLGKSVQPKIFTDSKGDTIEIDTLESQQAREYLEMYSSLTRRDLTKEQRLDILHHLKYLILDIKPEESVGILIKLIDRECDLLQIRLQDSALETLRMRIEQQFLDFLRNNMINNNNENLAREKPGKSVQSRFRCSRCKVLKLCGDYNIHVKVTKFSICYSCEWLMHIGYQKLDFSPYLRVLLSVRRTEMNLYTNSVVSYILQATGMYFLVNNIWSGKSALSEKTEIGDLRMVRWKHDEDWSPWNCILLTQDEARTHISIENVDEYYAQPFLDSVNLKHKRAKNHFYILYITDKYMRKTGMWYQK